MTAADLLTQTRAAGVELWATPQGTLHWRAAHLLPDDLRQTLAAHKAELL